LPALSFDPHRDFALAILGKLLSAEVRRNVQLEERFPRLGEMGTSVEIIDLFSSRSH
jgi:hypothetical protein